MAEFLPLIIVGVLMYAVLILPQQRRTKEHKRLLASLEEGDEVLLSSGVYGFINALESDIIWLEVSEGVEMKVARSSVANKIVLKDDPEGDSVGSAKEQDEDKDS